MPAFLSSRFDYRRLGQQHRQFVVDKKKIKNRATYYRTDLFRRFGRNSCFFDPGFSGSIKHLGAYHFRYARRRP